MLEIDIQIATQTRTLALLTAQTNRVRAELLRLRGELIQGRRDLKKVQEGFLAACNNHVRDANERLVIAALEADTKAETIANDLDELSWSSQRDPLTDTPNRSLMLDRLKKAMANANRRGNRIALLFLDIDKFKYINDSFGHAVGDDVVQTVARRLESVVRSTDTVSRHSGDEFLVLLTDVIQASHAALIAEKLLATIAEPFYIQDRPLSVSISIGITVYPEDGTDAETLIARADEAMYQSKRAAVGGFKFHQQNE